MGLSIYLYRDVDIGESEPRRVYVFDANYTHNCARMAEEAGIYKYVWKPEECEDVKTAGDLVEPLRRGINEMESNPSRFIAHNPENGWGSYDSFLPWLRKYLIACMVNENASISASR